MSRSVKKSKVDNSEELYVDVRSKNIKTKKYQFQKNFEDTTRENQENIEENQKNNENQENNENQDDDDWSRNSSKNVTDLTYDNDNDNDIDNYDDDNDEKNNEIENDEFKNDEIVNDEAVVEYNLDKLNKTEHHNENMRNKPQLKTENQKTHEEYVLDTEKYRKLNNEKFKEFTHNDLLNVLMVRGCDEQNPVLFGNALSLYKKLNFASFRERKFRPKSRYYQHREKDRNNKREYHNSRHIPQKRGKFDYKNRNQETGINVLRSGGYNGNTKQKQFD